MTLETLQAEVVDDDCSSEILEINREIAMMDEIIPILNARVDFVNDMKHRKILVHLQVPVPKVPPPNAEILQVLDSCSACGLLMYDEEALGIFILTCKHAYHIYYFANLAGREGKCMAASCGHVIPDNIKELMFIDSGGDTSTGCLKFDAVKGDLNTEMISKEFEGGATITARFDKEETNCNLEEEIQMMDDDALPIAHEILAELELVRDEVELSKSHNPSKPFTFIPINKEKSPSKSPCIAEAFAAARNARKCKVISGGARGDQFERLDAANESKTEELEPLGCSSWRWVKSIKLKGVSKSIKLKGVSKIMSTLRRIGFAHKEPTVGLGANDNAGGDALGKEGRASGWTRWKDVQMPFPLGIQPDSLMKEMPPLTCLSQKVL
ncbi:hypothetical protein L7F22_037515, partial [Adiantum nelumboides]|nr:hypothetical protein [Adiantum nelumboides]